MLSYRMGGDHAPRRTLTFSPDKLVVRHAALPGTETAARPNVRPEALAGFAELEAYAAPEVGVAVYATPATLAGSSVDVEARRRVRDRAREQLRSSPEIRFAGRALEDAATGGVVLYTENLFVRFVDGTREAKAREVLAASGVRVKQGPDRYGVPAFVASADGRGTAVFAIAEKLLERADVVAAHPELIVPRVAREAGGGWHLGAKDGRHRGSGATAAWSATRGRGATIAIIDDGVDVDHPAFAEGHRIDAPHAIGSEPTIPSDHGTACAGVAASADPRGLGVAPEARLVPIQLRAGLGSFLEADAILWAVDQGADVILCAWGRPDGHGPVPLPDVTRLALEVAATRGRGGRGCPVVWAAGNGNETLDDDGYASHPSVITVGAANALGQRASYSDFGVALWCLFPSSDVGLPGIPAPVPGGGMTAFGGTSAAAAGVAGVCALMIAANPDLSVAAIRNLLRRTATPIEAATARYDASGHSPRHGYGLVRADAAVAAAATHSNSIAEFGDAFGDGRRAEAVIVEVAAPTERARVTAAISAWLKANGKDAWTVLPVEHHPHLVDVVPVGDQPVAPAAAWDLVHGLADVAGVRRAEPSFEAVRVDVVPAPEALPAFCELDPSTDVDRLGARWHHDLVHTERAWAHSEATPGAIPMGGGILVAHPDSGYRPHRALQTDRIDPRERDFIDGDLIAVDDRDGGHGLATASVVLGNDRAAARGQIGTAPNARLLPLRVVRRTIFAFTVPLLVEVGMRRLRDAIDYAVDHDAHVVSISLGGLGGEVSARAAIRRAVEHGVIVLAAAGNVVRFVVNPAAFTEVIAVAACDVHRRPWRYTSSGPAVAVTAPGAAIWRAHVDEEDEHVSGRSCGTSFAVAIVAGAAAAWLAHHGRDALIARYGAAGLVAAFRRALTQSAAAAASLPPARFGAGILDLHALLKAPLPAIRSTTPRAERSRPALPALARVFPDLAPGSLAALVRQLMGTQTDDEVASLEAELAFVFETSPRLAESLRKLAFASTPRRSRSLERAAALFDLRIQLRSAGVSHRLAERLAPTAPPTQPRS